MKVSFIGSGNVATHLATALNKLSGVSVLQIISKNKSHAKNLAMQVKADYTDELSRLKTNFDLLIFAVSDDSLLKLVKEMDLPDNKILCHTSGSIPSTIFENVTRKFGVIYPLQTFSKNKSIDWRDVPLLITTSDESTEKRLCHIARQLSKNTELISDEQRFALHVAAVFACNFSNAALTVSQLLCEENNLDFNLLHPLINETFDKALGIGPRFSQTGPAKRGDESVMARHMDFLKGREIESQFYEVNSKYIGDLHNNKD